MARHLIELTEQPPENCDMPLFTIDGVGNFFENLDSDGDCDDSWPSGFDRSAGDLRCPFKPGEKFTDGNEIISVAVIDKGGKWHWEIETNAEPISRVSIHTKAHVPRFLTDMVVGTVADLMEALKELPPQLALDHEGLRLTWVNIGYHDRGMTEHLNIDGANS